MYTTMITSRFLAVILFSVSVLGHMQISYPPPLRSKFNPFANQGSNDASDMTSPLSPSEFPCKGFLGDIGTAAGASVATWTAGQNYNFTMAGSAVHGGGTCQAAISMDAGKSFRVIHTFQGGCPLSDGQSFSFELPSDTPAGAAVFGWIWYNNVGNREIYMNCASITIASGSGPAPKIAFANRPDLFVANLDNGCGTVDSTDVIVPNPGPDFSTAGTAKAAAPTGTCQAVKGIGGEAASSSSGSGASSSAAAPVASSASPASSSSVISIQILPSSTAAPSVFMTTTSISQSTAVSSIFTTSTISSSAIATSSIASSAGTASTPQSTGGSTSGLTPSIDGQCSGSQTCSGQSIYGPCCSQWGWCGDDAAHCGTGCMAGFGSCGLNATSPSTGLRPRHVRQFKI